jgi:hypothetical protein
MTNPNHAIVAQLERDWGENWQIWWVPTWDGNKRGTIWCARRWDDEHRVLNASSPEELVADLEAEAGR